ncbi:hypothetical protein FRC09_020614 [Ceratobasidium sp. 395]|nr:hypothetical protein FRC09_020614 [Ceratobasidium sp. 395]
MAPLAPSPRGSYQSPNDFLAAIGRSSDTKLKAETWDDLWRMRGEDMKKAGLTPAERRQAVEYPHVILALTLLTCTDIFCGL